MIIMLQSSSNFFRRKYIEAGHFNHGRRPIQNINDHRRNHHLTGYRRRDGWGRGGWRQWGSKLFCRMSAGSLSSGQEMSFETVHFCLKAQWCCFVSECNIYADHIFTWKAAQLLSILETAWLNNVGWQAVAIFNVHIEFLPLTCSL